MHDCFSLPSISRFWFLNVSRNYFSRFIFLNSNLFLVQYTKRENWIKASTNIAFSTKHFERTVCFFNRKHSEFKTCEERKTFEKIYPSTALCIPSIPQNARCLKIKKVFDIYNIKIINYYYYYFYFIICYYYYCYFIKGVQRSTFYFLYL